MSLIRLSLVAWEEIIPATKPDKIWNLRQKYKSKKAMLEINYR